MTDNQEEFFPITNEDGNITGSIMKNEIHDGSKMLHPLFVYTCLYQAQPLTF